jgi:shikimate dehydrogenase
MDLQEYRRQLNAIDDQVVSLFTRRMEIVTEIALWKQQQGMPVLDRSREESILQRLAALHPEQAENIRRLYEAMFEISRDAQSALLQPTFGLLGHPLGHSHSPKIHQRLADYNYKLFDIAPEKLDGFFQEGNFQGLNVTIPYKQRVMEYCEELSPLANRLQAVNTLVRKPSGSLYGDNTDYTGLVYALRHAGIELKKRKVLILGTGATSRTAHAVAEDAEAGEIVHVSRKGPVRYGDLSSQTDAEVIINTTPVGMFPHNTESLIDLTQFPRCLGVVDVIYNPQWTPLLLQAKSLGIAHANGLAMLVAQAKTAAEMFMNKPIDDAKIEEIFNVLKEEVSNLVLIGMPGAGKTSLGQRIAEQMQRPFYDSDEILAQEQGCSPGELIRQCGEEAFRTLETGVITRLGKHQGVVIATGGGSILKKENRDALQQNGILLWIQRDLSKLSLEGRPLSENLEQLQQLYAGRAPLYEACSRKKVENNASLEDAVLKIWEVYHEIFNSQRS